MKLKNKQELIISNDLFWYKLGLIVIVASTAYAIILFFSEILFLINLFTNKALFEAAFVEYSNLLMIICLLTNCFFIDIKDLEQRYYYIINIIKKLYLLGVILIILSPIGEIEQIVLNSYIPIMNNLFFTLGLSCFVVTIIFTHIIAFNTKKIANITLLMLILATFISFTLSYHGLKAIILKYPVDLLFFYENLLWSGSHIMHFAFTQILMIAWYNLFQLVCNSNFIKQKIVFYNIILILNTVLGISGLLGNLIYNMEYPLFQQFYISQMKYFGTIIPIIFSIMLFYELLIAHQICLNNCYYNGLISSIILFLSSNIIGWVVPCLSVNLVVHWGTVAGIVVIFMTVSYFIIDRKYFVSNKIAILQLRLFSVSYLLYIYGFVCLDCKLNTTSHQIMLILYGGKVMIIIALLLFVFLHSYFLFVKSG